MSRALAVASFAAGAAATLPLLVASCSDDPVPAAHGVSIPPLLDAGPDTHPDADAAVDAPVEEDAGPIISINDDSEFEGETQVAVSKDGTIGVAWIASYTSTAPARVAYRFSKDQGASWSRIRYVSDEVGAFTGDPSIAVAENGDFYIGWLAVDLVGGAIGDSYVWVGRIPAGSDEIATAAEASDPVSANTFRDHSKMTVTAGGTVVIAYLEAPSFENPFGPGVSARSADQGKTWQRSLVHDVAPDEFVNLFYLCKPNDGGSRIYATYFYGSSKTVDVLVRYSDDDAATWSVPVGLNKGPIFAGGVDPTCVAKGDDVWVGYGVSNLPLIERTASQAQQGIRIAHSPDQGQTFEPSVDATDKTTGKLFLHPTIAIEDDGALDLVFYAGQAEADRTGGFHRRRWARGVFGPSEAVASPLTFELERSTPSWLGDYVGLVSRQGVLHVAYTDNSTGIAHVGYQRFDLP